MVIATPEKHIAIVRQIVLDFSANRRFFGDFFLTLTFVKNFVIIALLYGIQAVLAQMVERIHGKDEVPSSILGNGSLI